MQARYKAEKADAKLEKHGEIELPVDFDDPGMARELSEFLERNKAVLTFRFPKGKGKTMVICFSKAPSESGPAHASVDGAGHAAPLSRAYDPSEVPSYIR